MKVIRHSIFTVPYAAIIQNTTMLKRLYFNLMAGNGNLHYGAELNDERYLYIRQAEPGTHHALYGYLDVVLKNSETASWTVIRQVVDNGLAAIGEIKDQYIYEQETEHGWLRILKRPDIPIEADSIINLLQNIA